MFLIAPKVGGIAHELKEGTFLQGAFLHVQYSLSQNEL